MKRIFTKFKEKVTGKKEAPELHPMKGREVRVTGYSQPHVLQTRMREQKMEHADTVIGDIKSVRVEANPAGPVMYFCPVGKINVKRRIALGDGGPLPDLAVLENIAIPEELGTGLFDLKNVLISSNGTLQVKATKETTWEKIDL